MTGTARAGTSQFLEQTNSDNILLKPGKHPSDLLESMPTFAWA